MKVLIDSVHLAVLVKSAEISLTQAEITARHPLFRLGAESIAEELRQAILASRSALSGNN